MKTVLILEIEHSKPIADLAEMITARAYCLDGVDDAHLVGFEPIKKTARSEHGFTAAELALGEQEVHRS